MGMNVAVLGATGLVGQRIIQLLDGHPLFTVHEVFASGGSAGRRYGEARAWKLPTPLPTRAGQLSVKPLDDPVESSLVLSALPGDVAAEVEERLADAGHFVCTNAGAHRMDPDVPLVIPEVNPAHLDALQTQSQRRSSAGFIVANPNCSAIGLLVALKPLADAFGLAQVNVTTLQAVSGAGYPGVASLDAIDNVVPHIEDEEHKMEVESRKILGEWDGGGFRDATIEVSATCTRVPVSDGHLECVSVALRATPSLADVRAAMRDFRSPVADLQLPSAPDHPVVVSDASDRPQPRLDRDAGRGMTVTVGRLRHCSVLGYKFVVLSHNLVRGAAGAAVLNAELLHARGLLG
ncbi:MAG: aspartate-semialdehyde dehydrogenase [Candidatus Dormibacteria bacterium]